MERGLIFNIQKYSVQDGPGIRTTLFLKGCPLRCAWCHNPEGISPQREVLHVESRCLVCGACREACPFGADPTVAPARQPARPERCAACGGCVEACPVEARQMAGREVTVAGAMDQILQDRIFYDESNGGATFSGGEPLMQPAFLGAMLKACRKHGIHTAVDTSGFAAREHLLAVAALTDLFLFDLKIVDDAEHRNHTGVSVLPILQNLRALDAVHDRIWIRVPLIPGVTDTDENMREIGRLAAGLSHVRRVSLLPYHPTGLEKARRLGRGASATRWKPPSPVAVQRIAKLLQSFGLDARIGA